MELRRVEDGEATGNPHVLSFALLAYGLAFRDTDPDRALGALRRGLVIARDSGDRANESSVAANLCLVEAKHGDPVAALNYFALAIRNYHDSGNMGMIHSPLGALAAFFDRLGRHEPAATIAGFAVVDPLAALVFPDMTTAIAHLHEVLGGPVYESLAHDGETMTTRDGGVRVRPNRPDPSRTERRLELDPNETPVGTTGGHVRNLRNPSGVTP